MRQKLINLFKDRGFLITLACSLLTLSIFFGKPLFHANTTYFGTDGDGAQAYFTALYHTKHDDSFVHFKGMNYPYGENVFFTGCQPLLTGPLKLFGLYNITSGIMNLIMLLSIVLSALFIYLIFKELEVPWLYAALSACAIAFLSPQLIRLFAHFSLTYQFAIPAFIYMLMRFHKFPTIKKSIFISVFTFFMAATHLYFFGFIILLAGFYWAALFLSRQEPFRKFLFCLKHFFIQIILPYVLLQLIVVSFNNVHDRTHTPWGFLIYKTNWTGVFYPFSRYYEIVPQWLGIVPQEINGSEGNQFVGLTGTLLFIFLGLKLVYNVVTFKFRKVFSLTGNFLLDVFLWCSFFALLYSFGYPFIFGHEDWLNNLGVIKQMRGIARFAWIFFYVMNIAAVYMTYRMVKNLKKSWIRISALSLIVVFLSLDAYPFLGYFNNGLNNKIPELSDKNNKNWRNAVFKTLDVNKYQAIIPLPYFHIGSENVGFEIEGKMGLYSYIFSLKTGLPLVANLTSRTSLSQTFKCMAIGLEKTSEPLEIIKDLPNKKPFLLLVNPEKIRPEEKELLKYATYLKYYIEGLELYSLEVDSLASIPKQKYKQYKTEMDNSSLFPKNEFLCSDSMGSFAYKNFDNLPAKVTFKGKGAISYKMKQYNNVFSDTIPNCHENTKYIVSYWMYDIKADLYPRTTIACEIKDKDDKYVTGYWINTGSRLSCVVGNWGLIETDIVMSKRTDKLFLTVFNFEMNESDSLIIDELMIRPASYDLYKKDSAFVSKNNRYYYKNKKQ